MAMSVKKLIEEFLKYHDAEIEREIPTRGFNKSVFFVTSNGSILSISNDGPKPVKLIVGGDFINPGACPAMTAVVSMDELQAVLAGGKVPDRNLIYGIIVPTIEHAQYCSKLLIGDDGVEAPVLTATPAPEGAMLN